MYVFLFILATPAPPVSFRPCNPSPCGINAYCHERFDTAICECISNYRGNPYQGCQPECLMNADCPKSQACIRTRCQDPCPATCGVGAICTVSNHVPICSCPLPTIGDAFTLCRVPVEGNFAIFSLFFVRFNIYLFIFFEIINFAKRRKLHKTSLKLFFLSVINIIYCCMFLCIYRF